MSDNNQVETVRSIMERALSIAGLHASKGKLLWEVYREFEMIVLLSLKVKCTLFKNLKINLVVFNDKLYHRKAILQERTPKLSKLKKSVSVKS